MTRSKETQGTRADKMRMDVPFITHKYVYVITSIERADTTIKVAIVLLQHQVNRRDLFVSRSRT